MLNAEKSILTENIKSRSNYTMYKNLGHHPIHP